MEATYDEVARLAEQLSSEDQQALIAHLQGIIHQRELSSDEWNAALASIRVHITPGPLFSDRRSDWYDDDGR